MAISKAKLVIVLMLLAAFKHYDDGSSPSALIPGVTQASSQSEN